MSEALSSPRSSPPASSVVVAAVIARRELVRFMRQPARIMAAIGTPIMLWLLMGSGFVGQFRPAGLGDVSYAAFVLPGAVTLVAVFSAIFSSISIIEDRNEGWLQGVMVAPVPRWSIALGKVGGGAVMAFAQAALVLLALPLLDVAFTAADVAVMLAALGVTCFAMAALGVAFAWVSETTAGFHAVMNLVFMPMWLLSGAFFPPPESASGIHDAAEGIGGAAWLAWLMRINPLTWCTEAIRNPLLDQPWGGPLSGAIVFAIAMFAVATAVVSRGRRGAAR